MLSVTEVAKEFGVSRQTILNWIKAGRIEAIQPFRDYKISEEEVARLKSNVVK